VAGRSYACVAPYLPHSRRRGHRGLQRPERLVGSLPAGRLGDEPAMILGYRVGFACSTSSLRGGPAPRDPTRYNRGMIKTMVPPPLDRWAIVPGPAQVLRRES
jgi:hypothetical protein